MGPLDWEPTLTDDPALVARGQALFDQLPLVADAKRDPYATACGIPGVDYCASSPTLTPEALIAATGAAIEAQGAHLVHRVCAPPEPDALLPDLCLEVYSSDGVMVSITGSDEPVTNHQVPTFVYGQVLTSIPSTMKEATPLEPWRDLGIVPAGWGEPPCAVPSDGGCVRYQGPVTGAGTPEDARQVLRARLVTAGYRVEVDQCTKNPSGETRCRVAGSRFRALGGHERQVVIALLSPADATAPGFKGIISVSADGDPS